jgi:hypothetical protein
VGRVPTTQEEKALTLLGGVLLRRWRKITTRSLINFLDLKPTGHVLAKQGDEHYVWITSEGRPTLRGGMGPLVLATKMWRL